MWRFLESLDFDVPARNSSGIRGIPLEDMSTYPPDAKGQEIQGVPDELRVLQNREKDCICMCRGVFWKPWILVFPPEIRREFVGFR